jgi:hypothetical protein
MPRIRMTTSALIESCRRRCVELLRRNLGTQGILAATPSKSANARGYAAVFGRDAAICALGMAVSGDEALAQASATGLLTLAENQAPNGQIPKFVDTTHATVDFWYLGCIDATLWWLIAIAHLDAILPQQRLRRRLAPRIRKAVFWLQCQEHQSFFLLQQNEASDWADIMPRSGFVLYTNALWLHVKSLYRLPHREETLDNAEHLFHPFGKPLATYRRARLLAHYARDRARNRDLYLSFVNFSFFGDEGDAFGNALAILTGLADVTQAKRVTRAFAQRGSPEHFPVRAVCDPIPEDSFLWRPYMLRHRQNLPWQYHNGGIWPFVGAFWSLALKAAGDDVGARAELEKVAQANALARWRFSEWLHGQTNQPAGMAGQSWNAAAFLMAHHALDRDDCLFPGPRSP